MIGLIIPPHACLRMPHFIRTAIVLAIALVVFCPATWAQDIEELPDPLIVQLNERAVRGGASLGEAIGSFARIGEWELVDRWLAPLAANNDEDALAEIAGQIGPSILLRISGRTDLSNQSLEAVKKLGLAARKRQESKDRLVAAISGLGGSTDQRLAAMRILLSGSDTAVAALVEAAIAPQPPAPRDEILRVMVYLGDGGRLALDQLALYGEPQTRVRALESLMRIDRKGSTPALLTALHASDSTAAETEFARNFLNRLIGSVPGKEESIAALAADLRRKRNAARLSQTNSQTTTSWNVNQARNGVSPQRTLDSVTAYRDAADAAARLRRIGALPPRVLDMTLAADMSYRVIVDPDWGDKTQVDAIRSAYGSAASGSGLSNSIATAINNKDDAATVGLMRMIDSSASVLDKNFLLSGSSPRMTTLVQATTHSVPRIRYEAAAAIMRLAPRVPYAGSSNVKRCLFEMQSLTDRPIAMLVETRADVIVQQEQILSDLGFDVRVVGSVSDLLREVARGSEIGLIVSKTQLADYPPIELIDRVRRIPRGRYLPIIFFGQPAAGIDSDRWDAMTRLIQPPSTPAVFSDIIIGIERIERVPPSDEGIKPLAILVESRDLIIDQQESILEELGYTVTVVKSLDSLKQDLSLGGDVRLIVAAVQLPEIRSEDLVKLVRQHPKFGRVPIAFYRESLSGVDLEPWDPFSGQPRQPNTASAYSNILLEIRQAQPLPPLTALDRKLYRDIGSRGLANALAGG